MTQSNTNSATTTLPQVRYFRAGGFNQLCLDTADDLKLLAQLDQALWVASSCPTEGLAIDERTLQFIDTDSDGRIRVPEVLAAVKWILARIKDPSPLPYGDDWIALEQIVTADDEGVELADTARHALANLGRADSTRISLADILDRQGIFATAPSAGDGVIPASATNDPALSAAINDIISTTGAAISTRGTPGTTALQVDSFYTALQDYADWWLIAHPAARNELPAEQQENLPELEPTIFHLGEQTAAASAAVEAIAAKIDEYFENCELAAFDSQAVSFLNFSDRDMEQLAGRTREEIADLLQKLPLARVQPRSSLPLAEGINPYYAEALSVLNQTAVAAVFGEQKQTLTQDEWVSLRASFAPYRSWLAAKAGDSVEPLGLARIFELLRDNQRPAIENLFKADAAIAKEMRAVDQVEKLLRFHRDMFRFLNNYVSLPEFYDDDAFAIFQMGYLIIDGCTLKLCVEVDDINRHSSIASKAGIFLIYCQLSRKGEPGTKMICCAVTFRDAGRITVDKNAVFYDLDGKDWDALVVKVIANPISLREAAWAPFKRIGNLISNQLDKLANPNESEFGTKISKSISGLESSMAADSDLKLPKSSGSGGMGVVGILAGGGLAIAAISSAFAFVVHTLERVSGTQLLYAAAIVILCIILPSVLVGYLKLRRRDIGMLLEACGWAINGRMRISFRLAKDLMNVSDFSKSSRRTYPKYAQKSDKLWLWIAYIFLMAAIAGSTYYAVDTYLTGRKTEKHETAPESHPTPQDVLKK